MTGFNELLAPFPYIDLPHQVVSWLGLLLMAALLAWGIYKTWQGFPIQSSRQWLLVTVLLLIVPLTSLLIGFRLPGERALPLPNLPGEATIPVVLLLSAVPWTLAGGLLGVFPAVVLAFLSGLLMAFWGTHSLFTPIEISGLALLFSLSVRQSYRTRLFQFLRHPVGAALLLSLGYIPIFVVSAIFAANGSLAVRLDFALTQNWYSVIARLLELILAGIVCEILFLVRFKYWIHPAALRPSPQESSLQTRFLVSFITLFVFFLVALVLGDWLMAGSAARRMIEGRMSSTALVASESLPYFLESGQSLMLNIAKPELTYMSSDQLKEYLSNQLKSVPYFRALYLFDTQGNPMGGYPYEDVSQLRLQPEEEAGLLLAGKGVLSQSYTTPPFPGENTVQISFISSVKNSGGQVVGILLGRTDLQSNPFTQPALQALESIAKDGGEGLILDEQQRVLFDTVPDSTIVMKPYTGELAENASFFDDTSSTGTRQMVYYQPVTGRSWSVVLFMPALRAQQLALNIAGPLLAILLSFSAIAIVALSLGLRGIIRYLQTLSGQATLISRGQLDSPLAVQGEDEVGRLAVAFEKMRLSLKARLEELNRLLTVSQGVAANLEIQDAVKPILEAALVDDAVLARLVFIPEVQMELQGNKTVSYGIGPRSEVYSHLDGQIFDLMRTENLVSIPNLARVRRLNMQPGRQHPSALIALPLYYENNYFGTLWVGFDSPRSFTEEQVRFLTTLAGEAALAAANARLYATAEIGRQRLEAVLSSTPEPALVFDEQDRLLLLNPSAMQVTGLIASAMPGKAIADVIIPQELRNLLSMPVQAGRIPSRELTLQNKIYYASVSPVNAEGYFVGKVCTLRDITHFKELDSLKSDFVATVSHDLRSPMTLMRGYTTMLQMVGELNEQQRVYLQKITDGINHMNQLVNSLLDLGRIEAGIGLRLERVSPQETADHVINSLQPQAAQKNVKLFYEVEGENSGTIEADEALLRQALYNLVENGIKYTRSNGQVKIRIVTRQDRLTFEVLDTGIGIAPLDIPRVFEKFYRSGSREAFQQRGTGLGLAIVKSIAERHEGRVWVESQLGKGSTFFLEIPFHPAQKAEALK